MDPNILSDELRAMLPNDGTPLVLPSRQQKKRKRGASKPEADARPLSKSQQRKLRKLQEKKVKEQRRAPLMQSLAQHELSAQHMQLMTSSNVLGSKRTAKQRLRRALLRDRAGLAQDEDAKLVQAVAAQPESASEASSASDAEDGEPAGAAAPLIVPTSSARQRILPFASQPAAASATAAGASSTAPATAAPAATPDAAKPTAAASSSAARTPAITATTAAHSAPGAQSERPRHRAFYVPVSRPAELQEARMQLPVCQHEQEVMEAVLDHPIVVLCGETGSGKTTQLPQFLYEAGFGHPDSRFPGRVAVTQPRRVAATSTAQRVAQELGTSCDGRGFVAYQIRHDARTVTSATRIKFMTDGVLLRELEADALLRQYSAVVLDEVHERGTNTDLLLGLLSRVVRLRQQVAAAEDAASAAGDAAARTGNSERRPRVGPLKLIIMSATLRVEDFRDNRALFPTPPPVVTVQARQHPVTVHFSRRTELGDYVRTAVSKACKIHRRLPHGGVLVFLTGREEVERACAMLRELLACRPGGARQGGGAAGGAEEGALAYAESLAPEEDAAARREWSSDALVPEPEDEAEAEAAAAAAVASAAGGAVALFAPALPRDEPREGGGGDTATAAAAAVAAAAGTDAAPSEPANMELSSDEEDVGGSDADSVLDEQDDGSAELRLTELDLDQNDAAGPALVLPLYAMLPPWEQRRVFQPPPPGHRLIVVATNVAETSLTIPNIAYVVDCGREKRRVHDMRTGVSRFEVGWVSQASAQQRTGRAGRTGPGHCYRLYSSAVFSQQFQQYSPPEITQFPLDAVVLRMKSMRIQDVLAFPFPSAPDPAALRAAEHTLTVLGALNGDARRITPLGDAMARYPVAPRLAKMLVLAARSGVLPHVAAAAAVLAGQSPLLNPGARRSDGGEGSGAGAVETGGEGADDADLDAVAAAPVSNHDVWRHPDSDALSLLRVLGAFEHESLRGAASAFCKKYRLHEKTLQEATQLRAQLLVIANRSQPADAGPLPAFAPLSPPAPAHERVIRQVLAAGLLDHVARVDSDAKVARRHRLPYRVCASEVAEEVYAHPQSFVRAPDTRLMPRYVVYQELVQGTKRQYMRGVTAIDPAWLPDLAAGTQMCQWGEVLSVPPPRFDEALDQVMCHRRAYFGPLRWELPLTKTVMPNSPLKARWVARLVLEGSMVPGLLPFANRFSPPPAAFTRDVPHPKAVDIVSALREHRAFSRAKLRQAWRADPAFLLGPLKKLLADRDGRELESQWRQVIASV